ncbi:MAG: cytidylate kinase family protein [Patescibacteria group bacterium]
MKITITGMPGSGKTSVGKELAKNLGLDFFSIGDFRGKMAMDRGITIEELNRIGETEDWTDKEADDYQKKYGETHENFIVEGRLAFYFIPDSIKIFLDVDLRKAAERVWRDPRPDEKKRASVEDEMQAIINRIESDKKRYLKYYGVDPHDKKQFDIVIDTTDISREETLEKLKEKIKTIPA